jgi:hypothetical protein
MAESTTTATLATTTLVFGMDEARVQIGMKMEQKLSDFSVEIQKCNENTETRKELCKTKIETEFFLVEVETKQRFTTEILFIVVMHGQCSMPNQMDLPKQPIPHSTLHRVTVLGWETSLVYFL